MIKFTCSSELFKNTIINMYNFTCGITSIVLPQYTIKHILCSVVNCIKYGAIQNKYYSIMYADVYCDHYSVWVFIISIIC